jgi:hypothetical protein
LGLPTSFLFSRFLSRAQTPQGYYSVCNSFYAQQEGNFPFFAYFVPQPVLFFYLCIIIKKSRTLACLGHMLIVVNSVV